MKTTMMILAAALGALAVQGEIRPKAPQASKSVAPIAQPVMAAANDAFAVAMYGRMAAQKGNVFFSPSSIHTALAMTYAGAAGQTATQMFQALALPGDLPATRVHPAYKAFLDVLKPGKDAGYQLNVANALWGQKGFAWLPEFLKTTKDNYGAGLREVDFAGATEEARKTVNGWVEKETKDKIKDLLPRGILTADTRLVLTNAVYFKGDWAVQFDKRATADAPFHLSADKTVQAPLMYRKDRFGYTEDQAVQVLSIPYKGNELSMVVLLPKALDGLPAVEKDLNPIRLNGLLGGLRPRKVEVYLPKFKATCRFRLEQPLQALGMIDAFDAAKADFSGMDGKKDLYVTAVVHKAFVDVHEEGTEAAAATGVAIGLTSAMPDPEPVFRADHPFLFLIRHNATGAILFMGRLADPKA